MYAIVEVAGKQVIVQKDEIVEVEKLSADAGKELVLDKVLLIAKGDKIDIGQPYIKGASVKVEVLRQLKGAKTVSFKYRRRKSKDWKVGHRQLLTALKIKEIAL